MDTLRTILWSQFGATLDMFKQVLADCPDELWRVPMWGEHTDRPDLSEFWYVAYHTLFWLDLYLSGNAEEFRPPEPFTLSELDPTGLMPDRVYRKSELQAYLAHSRQKCHTIITEMTEAEANRTCTSPSWAMSFAELLIYNMRHVQEHGAQLRMILGQQSGTEFSWGAQAKD